ncbi:MAG: MmgE/PrpD family protein [Caldisphaera sp.]
MKELADILADFVEKADYEDLSKEVIEEAKRRIIDSLGVATYALESPPALVNKKLVQYYPGKSKLIGGGTASPDFASFYNGLLIRYLDFNDTYLSKEPLHPSDMIASLLSVGSMFDVSGKDLILSIAVGYEVGVRLCDSTSLRKKGYDHVNFLEVAIACALSKMLHLNREQIVNAISISLVPHIALRETRSGDLSMWKAGAAANSNRNATFAVLAALNGFTGPPKPFSGTMGFINQIAKDFDIKLFEKMDLIDSILKTYVKEFPVEYHAEAAIEAALKIKSNNIKKVTIETYEAAKTILADKEKWRPKNRETADHSLPYVVATTLLKNDFWLHSYDYVNSPEVIDLMDRSVVVEIHEYTSLYPSQLPTKIIVELADGKKIEEEVMVPLGHVNRKMNNQQIEEKYIKLGGNKAILDFVWNLENKKVNDIV